MTATKSATTVTRKLNTGASIPLLGLGTWQSPKGEVEKVVEAAIVDSGYRHIDAAYAYGNEEEVGRGIAKAIASGKVTREEIFVTTKVFPTFHNRVEQSLNESLKNLGLEYVDLLLFHWPIGLNPNGNHPLIPTRPDGSRDLDPEFNLVKTWKQFEAVYKGGKAKAIGVSNVSVKYFEKFLPEIEIVPAANQIEIHPLCPETDVVDYAEKKGIISEAYSPFGSTGGPLFKNKVILDLASKYDVTPSVILVSYHINSGRVVLPKTTNPGRAAANAQYIELTKEELSQLDHLSDTEGVNRITKPAWGVDLGFPDWKV